MKQENPTVRLESSGFSRGEQVKLRYESEWKPTIDGEIAQPELPVGGSS